MNTISRDFTSNSVVRGLVFSPFQEHQASVSFQLGGHNAETLLHPTINVTALKHSPILFSDPKKRAVVPDWESLEKQNVPTPKATKASRRQAAKATESEKPTKPSQNKVNRCSKTKTNKSSKAKRAKHTIKRGSSLQANLKRPRAPWSGIEDDRMTRVLAKLLGKGFAKYEIKVNWADVATLMKTGRNAKQCRDRWMNYLRPGLKKGDWTRQEEDHITDMYSKFGPKWCAMAKMLPNRAENDIKNKWYSMMRKQKRCEEKLKLGLDSWTKHDVEGTDTCAMDVDSEMDENDDETEECDEDDTTMEDDEPVKPSGQGKDLSRLLAAQGRRKAVMY
ncbi:hypothetical protein ACA910_013033 [Epithemia clementina (nom. ined.)]